jgi:hypothetical protein
MTIGFDPNEVIEDTTATVEILKAVLSDTYGPQIGLKVKVIGGEHDGHTFMDYSSRDETTGNVKDNRAQVGGVPARSSFPARSPMGGHACPWGVAMSEEPQT